MKLASLWMAAAAALCAAPLRAQDTTQTKPDTAAKADTVAAPAPAAAGSRAILTPAN